MTAISSRPHRSTRRREPLGLVRLHEGLAVSVHLGWLVAPVERPGPGSIVAVKRLHPRHMADQVGIARVREEARLAMGVRHPNVVAMLGVVRRPGELLAAMEYVPGASLAEITSAAHRGLEPRVASAIAAGTLRGLHAAHEARPGALPRAMSPRRVLVGEDGRARVIDFDVSDPATLRTGAIVGELPYASPEQLLSRGADVRRDVYVASVVLWEMLTGRPLFHATTVEGTLREILSGAVPAPSRFAPGVGRELDAVVLRGLARDRSARFESASAMATALERAGHAPLDDVARALAAMDLACIRRRRALAEDVRRRERSRLHMECSGGVSKQ